MLLAQISILVIWPGLLFLGRADTIGISGDSPFGIVTLNQYPVLPNFNTAPTVYPTNLTPDNFVIVPPSSPSSPSSPTSSTTSNSTSTPNSNSAPPPSPAQTSPYGYYFNSLYAPISNQNQNQSPSPTVIYPQVSILQNTPPPASPASRIDSTSSSTPPSPSSNPPPAQTGIITMQTPALIISSPSTPSPTNQSFKNTVINKSTSLDSPTSSSSISNSSLSSISQNNTNKNSQTNENTQNNTNSIDTNSNDIQSSTSNFLPFTNLSDKQFVIALTALLTSYPSAANNKLSNVFRQVNSQNVTFQIEFTTKQQNINIGEVAVDPQGNANVIYYFQTIP